MLPGALSLRELLGMVEGRRRSEWNHTASLIAALFNVHGSKASAQDFHPMEAKRRKGLPMTPRMMGAMAAALGAERLTVPAGEIKLAEPVRKAHKQAPDDAQRDGQQQQER